MKLILIYLIIIRLNWSNKILIPVCLSSIFLLLFEYSKTFFKIFEYIRKIRKPFLKYSNILEIFEYLFEIFEYITDERLQVLNIQIRILIFS
jgi:hypothetical protein